MRSDVKIIQTHRAIGNISLEHHVWRGCNGTDWAIRCADLDQDRDLGVDGVQDTCRMVWYGVVWYGMVSYRAIHVHTLGGDSKPHQPYKEEAQAERPCK